MSKPPICPMLMADVYEVPDRGSAPGHLSAEHPRCLGSDCALWVPEMDRAHPTNDTYLPAQHPEGNPARKMMPTGRGWCAKNLRRPPWQDPAEEIPR